MLALAITPAPPRSMVVMPAVAVLMRPTVTLPMSLLSRYQFASVVTKVLSPLPPGKQLDCGASSSFWLWCWLREPPHMAIVILKPADRLALILASPVNETNVLPAMVLSETNTSLELDPAFPGPPLLLPPSFHAINIVVT